MKEFCFVYNSDNSVLLMFKWMDHQTLSNYKYLFKIPLIQVM